MNVIDEIRILIRDNCEEKIFSDDELLLFYNQTRNVFSAAALALNALLIDKDKFGKSVRLGSFSYDDSQAVSKIIEARDFYNKKAKEKPGVAVSYDLLKYRRKQVDEVDREEK